MLRKQIIALVWTFVALGTVQVGAKVLTLPEFGGVLSESAYNWMTLLTVLAGGLTMFIVTAPNKQKP